METLEATPSSDVVHALLDILAPGSRLQAITPLAGSFSNSTHVVEALDGTQAPLRFVIRRYAPFGSYDRGEKARREYSTLALLPAHGVPAPQPLYLDDQGAMLGIPGIVVSFVAGKQVVTPADPLRWARALAATLARIHAIPCQPSAECLLDGNSEAIWFARADLAAEPRLTHEDGPMIWRLVRELSQQLRPVAPGWSMWITGPAISYGRASR